MKQEKYTNFCFFNQRQIIYIEFFAHIHELLKAKNIYRHSNTKQQIYSHAHTYKKEETRKYTTTRLLLAPEKKRTKIFISFLILSDIEISFTVMFFNPFNTTFTSYFATPMKLTLTIFFNCTYYCFITPITT
jgi:hypothetical protein